MITKLLWYPDSKVGNDGNNAEWEKHILWPLAVGWRVNSREPSAIHETEVFQYALTIDDAREVYSDDPFLAAWFSVEPGERPDRKDMEMLELLASVYYAQRRGV